MKLQTNIPFTKQPHRQIDYNAEILLLGSCFSENIGSKFNYFKFKSVVNPLGILFHPIAIENLITRSINKDYYNEDELIYNNEVYASFDAHSKLSNSSSIRLLERLNTAITTTASTLESATHVIITLGTAWVYRHIETDTIVANCHKIPQKQFVKELLSVKTITESLEAIIALIRSVNPCCTFTFTVSPIRHLKDGFIENTRGKSHLLAALHEIIEPRKHIYYFPAYELMMDELRDYRFYEEDMIHPNSIAIDYIWNAFNTQWCSNSAQELMKEVDIIQKGLMHRPFNEASLEHQKFLQDLKKKQETLQNKVSRIQF